MAAGLLMRRRRGFTLIEVIISLVILTVVLLAIGSATAGYLHAVAESDRHAAAVQLAHSRIEEARLHPDYGTLAALEGVEADFPSLPGFTRTTEVVRYGGPGAPADFTRITVTIDGPGLTRPVARTISIGAP